MPDLNWIAIAAGALVAFLLGWLWYGPLFGKAWMAEHGLDSASCKSGKEGMGQTIGLNLLLMLAAAIAMEHVLGRYGAVDLSLALMVGGGIGLGFVATAIGTSCLYTKKSMRLFLIDAGYWVVAYAAMAAAEVLVG